MKKFMIGLGVAALSLGITAPAFAGSGGANSASASVPCRVPGPNLNSPTVTVSLQAGSPGEGILIVKTGETTLIDEERDFTAAGTTFPWPAGAINQPITIEIVFGSDPGVTVSAGTVAWPAECPPVTQPVQTTTTAAPTTTTEPAATTTTEADAGGPTLPAVTTAPATPTTQAQSGGPLPQTGTSVDTIIQVGALLAVGGLLVVIATRRRNAGNAS
jgi:LPXTG-motif cell wall-anchored protein